MSIIIIEKKAVITVDLRYVKGGYEVAEGIFVVGNPVVRQERSDLGVGRSDLRQENDDGVRRMEKGRRGGNCVEMGSLVYGREVIG